ncbi:MAG: glycosyltransferase family 9 protein [Chloroflexi bacterium]|nr:MAG: glycosyltransferase family 9 protein [Chloroflexota bacterium]
MPYVYWQPEFLRYLEVVGLVGARTAQIEPQISVTERDIQESMELLPKKDKQIIILHTGSGDPRRRWPPEKFARLGDFLSARDLLVVLVGIESERDIVQKVIGGMQHEAVDASGKTSLEALVGLMKRSALVVSNDSGPLHLAVATGAPTVGIYWGPNLVTAGPAARSNHRPHLAWTLACPSCGRNTIHDVCGHLDSLVSEVNVEDVFESAMELLATGDQKSLPLSEAN